MWESIPLACLLDEHLARYPAAQPDDIYKLLYQGVLGPEHLIASPEEFARRLQAEYEALPPDAAGLLWEPVRPDRSLGRLHLGPFKARHDDLEWLVTACLRTAGRAWGTPAELCLAWATFVALCRAGRWQAFALADVLALHDRLEAQGYPPLHHSAAYRQAYRPAYRLVAGDLFTQLVGCQVTI